MSREFIGVVTKPQALKGQFRIKPQLSNFKTYKKIKEVFIGNISYEVEAISLRDTIVVFKLKGIDSCEQAEALRNKDVYADIEVKVETHFDLEGYLVMINGEILGTIQSVNNYGATDIISISGKSEIMLPMIDGLVSNVNEEDKTIFLNKNIFEQVAVYEN